MAPDAGGSLSFLVLPLVAAVVPVCEEPALPVEGPVEPAPAGAAGVMFPEIKEPAREGGRFEADAD